MLKLWKTEIITLGGWKMIVRLSNIFFAKFYNKPKKFGFLIEKWKGGLSIFGWAPRTCSNCEKFKFKLLGGKFN